MSTGLTKAQMALYWRAFAAACRNLGLVEKAEREEYRKEVMSMEAGKKSIKELSKTADFDAVLARFQSDGGEYSAAIETGSQDLKRMAYLIKVLCLQLMQLKGGDGADARAYLGGMLSQARLPNKCLSDDSYQVEVSPKYARAVVAMLNTHRRRLLRRWSSHAAFSPTIRYEVNGPIIVRQEVSRDYYSHAPFQIIWRH
jgi:hypothetical protein